MLASLAQERHGVDQQLKQEQTQVRASRVSARREEAYRQSMLLAEARRRETEHRNLLGDEISRQREDLRQLQLQIKVHAFFGCCHGGGGELGT